MLHVDQVLTRESAAELLQQLGRRVGPHFELTWTLRTIDDAASDQTVQLLEVTMAYHSTYRGRRESHAVTIIERNDGGLDELTGEGEAWCEQIAVMGLLTDDDVWRLLDFRGRTLRSRRVEL